MPPSPQPGPERSGSELTGFTPEELYDSETGAEAAHRLAEDFEKLHDAIGYLELLGRSSVHRCYLPGMERKVVFQTISRVKDGWNDPFFNVIINDTRRVDDSHGAIDIREFGVGANNNAIAYQRTAAGLLTISIEDMLATSTATGPLITFVGDAVRITQGSQYSRLMPAAVDRLPTDGRLLARIVAGELTEILLQLGPSTHLPEMYLGFRPRAS